MSENVTLETIVDDDEAIFDEDYEMNDNSDYISLWVMLRNFEICYTALIIVIGIPSNIMALLLLVRRRLWHQHEAYVYVAAILTINILELVIHHSNRLVQHFSHRFLRFPTIADITCKVWYWAAHMIICINWLHVLMLLNIYFRQQLMMSNDRRGSFLNLAAKYCSLLGTKVVIISFFTFWIVAYFWSFSISSLQALGELFWVCTIAMTHTSWMQYKALENSTFWLGMSTPLIVGFLLILLIVWKRKSISRFSFSQMDGVSQDNGDVEAMAKIVLCCAALFFVLRAPFYLVYVMYEFGPGYLHNSHLFGVAFNAIAQISFSSLLSTPIVCFTVKSRFRDALKALVVGWCCRQCCLGTRSQRICSHEAEVNGSSVLQMDLIEEDSNIAKNEES